MAEENTPAEAPTEGAKVAAGGKGKLLLVAGAVVLLGGGGAAAWFLGLVPRGHTATAEAKEEHAEGEPERGAMAALESFIVNLSDEDKQRYLKTTLQVEFFEHKVPEEFGARTPQIRDLLLTLFSSKSFAEIRTTEGKTVLREEVINRINRAMRKDYVKAVYFTEFIVQ